VGYGIQGVFYVKTIEERPFSPMRRELLIVSSVLEELGIVEHDERILLDDRIKLLMEGVNPGDIDEILLFTAKQREFGLPIKVSYSVNRESFPFFENRNGEKSPDLTQFFEIF